MEEGRKAMISNLLSAVGYMLQKVSLCLIHARELCNELEDLGAVH